MLFWFNGCKRNSDIMKSEALCDETFYKDLGALINKGREVGGKIRDSHLEMSFYIWIWPNEP